MDGPGWGSGPDDRRPDELDPLRSTSLPAGRAVLRADLDERFDVLTWALIGGLLTLTLLRGLGTGLVLHGLNVLRAIQAHLDADPGSTLGGFDRLADWYAGIVGPIQLFCAVGFVAWIVRMASSSSVDPRALRRSPRWHAISFVAPVVSLWWPILNLRDLYAGAVATTYPTGRAPHVCRAPLFISAWWGLRLVTVWLTHLSIVYATSAHSLQEVRQSMGLFALAFTAGVPASAGAAYVVWRIWRGAGRPGRSSVPMTP